MILQLMRNHIYLFNKLSQYPSYLFRSGVFFVKKRVEHLNIASPLRALICRTGITITPELSRLAELPDKGSNMMEQYLMFFVLSNSR